MTINATGSWDAWQRQAQINIDDGTTSVDVEAVTETCELDVGERSFDMLTLLNLGQIPKFGPIGITTLTLEVYPLQAGTAAAGTATGVWDIFASKPAVDASGEMDVDLSNTLTRYRVAILLTNDDDATGAEEEIDSGDLALRFVMADCFCVSCKSSFTDGIFKQTLVMKGIAFRKDGTSNIKMESCTASDTLTALGTYTPGGTRWA